MAGALQEEEEEKKLYWSTHGTGTRLLDERTSVPGGWRPLLQVVQVQCIRTDGQSV